MVNKINMNIMKTILSFFQKHNVIMIITCIFLYALISVGYTITHNSTWLWLYIIPSLYAIPAIVIMVIFAWIVNPIKDLKK